MRELMSSFWNATETWDTVGCSGRRAEQMFKSCKGVVWLVLKAFISCCNNWGSLKILLWSGGVGITASLVSTLCAGWLRQHPSCIFVVLGFLFCFGWVFFFFLVLCVLLPVRWTIKGMVTGWFGDSGVISKEAGLWVLVDLSWPNFYLFIYLFLIS